MPEESDQQYSDGARVCCFVRIAGTVILYGIAVFIVSHAGGGGGGVNYLWHASVEKWLDGMIIIYLFSKMMTCSVDDWIAMTNL